MSGFYGEPDIDLGDYPLGYTEPKDDDYYKVPYYKYQFENEEQLVSSSVFQRCLSMALEKQQLYIDKLRTEILNKETKCE